MISQIETDWTEYGWIDFAVVTCDVCGETYPSNGLLSEYPLVVWEAQRQGWQVLPPPARLACCPKCHLQGFVTS